MGVSVLREGIEGGGRTEHLEGLPDGLLVKDMISRVWVGTVLDASHVLPFAPERITGALYNKISGKI